MPIDPTSNTSLSAAVRGKSTRPLATAAEAIEHELSGAYGKFDYVDATLGNKPAIRLDCTEASGAPEYMRHYCLEHNDHLLRLRFITTSRSVSEPEFEAAAVASIRLAEPATECEFGELALVDYAPASLECVLVGSLVAHGRGEELSGRHLIGSLVHGDSGIAASILQSLGATPERLGYTGFPWTMTISISTSTGYCQYLAPAFSLLTRVVPRYARDTVRSHHVLLGILSKGQRRRRPRVCWRNSASAMAEARVALSRRDRTRARHRVARSAASAASHAST